MTKDQILLHPHTHVHACNTNVSIHGNHAREYGSSWILSTDNYSLASVASTEFRYLEARTSLPETLRTYDHEQRYLEVDIRPAGCAGIG